MSTVEEKVIVFDNVGPVHHLELPIVPGVNLFRGANGVGKSVCIDALNRLAGGKADVSCREGAKSGSIEGLGITIKLGKSVRRTGELVATSIEDDFSIAGLVSPPIKDPEAADRQRIKALLKLNGTKPDMQRFRDALAIDLDGIASSKAIDADDIVEQAAQLKRDLEAASRRVADDAEKVEIQASACKALVMDIDGSVETDQAKLQKAHEDALFAHGQIVAKRQAALEVEERARDAQERMAKEASPPNIEEAKADVAAAESALKASSAELKQAADNLVVAQQRVKDCEAADKRAFMLAESAKRRLATEQAHAESLQGWQQTIDAAKAVQKPTVIDISMAEAKVNEARQAIEKAAVIRQARAKATEYEQHRNKARDLRRKAESLREAAKATDDVLSAAVDSKAIWVDNGRLMCADKNRPSGKGFYSDQSDGTRWRIAILEIVKRIQTMGAEPFFSIPQVAWSELQPAIKGEIHRFAKEHGVSIISAVADDGELRSEAFEGEEV